MWYSSGWNVYEPARYMVNARAPRAMPVTSFLVWDGSAVTAVRIFLFLYMR